MSVATRYLLTTEVLFDKENKPQLIAAWQKKLPANTNLYLSENEDTLLELQAVSELTELASLLKGDHFSQIKKDTKKYLRSDLRQELLSFVENVIPQKKSLPTGEFLQMRHIEVPLHVHDDYLDWRKDTIFKHVEKLKNIDSFVAYHSALSHQPGVMFVSSFSCSPKDYLAGFTNPTYQAIAQQAGDRFIVGGKQGLYTTLYKKI
ncbi:MAG: hypothetical protein ACD_29C00312G0001 [uncultured bacterium]|nr:MAG: hypothetical protein ACD_29C00312G0001 [uncultured bacterium]